MDDLLDLKFDAPAPALNPSSADSIGQLNSNNSNNYNSNSNGIRSGSNNVKPPSSSPSPSPLQQSPQSQSSSRSLTPSPGASTPASRSRPTKASPANDSFANLVSFNTSNTDRNLPLAERQRRLHEEKARLHDQELAQIDALFGDKSVRDRSLKHKLDEPKNTIMATPTSSDDGTKKPDQQPTSKMQSDAFLDGYEIIPGGLSRAVPTHNPLTSYPTAQPSSILDDFETMPNTISSNAPTQTPAPPSSSESVPGPLLDEFETVPQPKKADNSPRPAPTSQPPPSSSTRDPASLLDDLEPASDTTPDRPSRKPRPPSPPPKRKDLSSDEFKKQHRNLYADQSSRPSPSPRRDTSLDRFEERHKNRHRELPPRPSRASSSRQQGPRQDPFSDVFDAFETIADKISKKFSETFPFPSPSKPQPRTSLEDHADQSERYSDSPLDSHGPRLPPRRSRPGPRQNELDQLPEHRHRDALSSHISRASSRASSRPSEHSRTTPPVSSKSKPSFTQSHDMAPRLLRRPRESPSPVMTGDLLDGSSSIPPEPIPESRPKLKTQTKPQKSSPSQPSREVPAVSPASLAFATSLRKQGTKAQERGDYSAAHAHYGEAISKLPPKHPINILLLCKHVHTALKIGSPKEAVSDADKVLNVIGPSKGSNEVIELGTPDESDCDMKQYYSEALVHKAEGLEQLERWADAGKVWKEAVQAGCGGKAALDGRARCEKAIGGSGSAASAPRAAAGLPKKTNTSRSAAAAGPVSRKPAEAVNRLRAANEEADRVDKERVILTDSVDTRIQSWRNGKRDNLRALLASLDTVLWPELGWKKVSLAELVLPNKVKIHYMKGIAKVHPDKVSSLQMRPPWFCFSCFCCLLSFSLTAPFSTRYP